MTWPPSLWTTSSQSVTPSPTVARTHVDEEDGFFYDVLRLRRERDPPQGAFDGRSASALRFKRDRSVGARTSAQDGGAMVGEKSPEPGADKKYLSWPGYATRRHGLGHSGPFAAHARLYAGRERVSGPTGVRALSRYHLEHPYIFNVNARNTGLQYVPEIPIPACSAGTPTGAAPSGCRMNIMLISGAPSTYTSSTETLLPWSARPGPAGRCISSRWHAEISRRLVGAFLRDDNRDAAPCTGPGRSFKPTLTGAIILFSPSTSMATRGWRSGPVIRRDGPDWWALLIQNRGSLDPAQVSRKGNGRLR